MKNSECTERDVLNVLLLWVQSALIFQFNILYMLGRHKHKKNHKYWCENHSSWNAVCK